MTETFSHSHSPKKIVRTVMTPLQPGVNYVVFSASEDAHKAKVRQLTQKGIQLSQLPKNDMAVKENRSLANPLDTLIDNKAQLSNHVAESKTLQTSLPEDNSDSLYIPQISVRTEKAILTSAEETRSKLHGIQPDNSESTVKTPLIIQLPGKEATKLTSVSKNPTKITSTLATVPKAALTALFLAISIGLFALFVVPVVYYQFFSKDPVPIAASTSGTPLGGDFKDGAAKTPERRVPLPAYDESLPEGNWLIIPRIGVHTPILESAEPEESLKQGVWRVPDFGVPGDESKPMILAAHRFGYKWWWQSQYWRYHSFYLLPELEPGDRVEVISGKRKYVYEIYAGEEGEDISDYYADLILYTCKYLNAPLRHFRYARLIDPAKDSQATH